MPSLLVEADRRRPHLPTMPMAIRARAVDRAADSTQVGAQRRQARAAGDDSDLTS